MSLTEMSFYAAVMIAVIAVLRRIFLRRIPKAVFQILWAVVLLRLFVPFSVSSPVSIYNTAQKLTFWAKQTASAGSVQNPVSDGQNQGEDESDIQIPSRLETGGGKREAGIMDGDQAVQQAEQGTAARQAPAREMTFMPIFRAVWAAGAMMLALFFLLRYRRSLRLFRMSLPADNEQAARWLRMRTGKRKIQVRQSALIDTPLTYGIFLPVILLPQNMDHSDVQKFELIMEHEAAHIEAWDLVKKIILLAAVCVHWFNPFVWLMYVLANRDIELACDETVLRSRTEDVRVQYAMALIGMEEARTGFLPVGNFSGSALEERIGAIMKWKQKSFAGAAFAAALVLGVTGVFATTASEEGTGEGQQTEQQTEQQTGQQTEGKEEQQEEKQQEEQADGQVQVLDEATVEMIKEVGWEGIVSSGLLADRELLADYLDLYMLEQDGYEQKSVGEFDRGFEEWYDAHSRADQIFEGTAFASSGQPGTEQWTGIVLPMTEVWPITDPTLTAAYESLQAKRREAEAGQESLCRTDEALFIRAVQEDGSGKTEYTIRCRLEYNIADPEAVTVRVRNQAVNAAKYAIRKQIYAYDTETLSRMSRDELAGGLAEAAAACDDQGITWSVPAELVSFYKTVNGTVTPLGLSVRELTRPDVLSAEGAVGSADYRLDMTYDSGTVTITRDMHGFTDGMIITELTGYAYNETSGEMQSVMIGKGAGNLNREISAAGTAQSSLPDDLAKMLLAIECRYTIIEYPYYCEGSLYQKINGAAEENTEP